MRARGTQKDWAPCHRRIYDHRENDENVWNHKNNYFVVIQSWKEMKKQGGGRGRGGGAEEMKHWHEEKDDMEKGGNSRRKERNS